MLYRENAMVMDFSLKKEIELDQHKRRYGGEENACVDEEDSFIMVCDERGEWRYPFFTDWF